jgi:hypothetical protein
MSKRIPLKRTRNDQAQRIREQYAEVAGNKEYLSLDEIHNRVSGNTRETDDHHVQELVDSIAVLGLIHPLAVDQSGALLAGGHRKAALHILHDQHNDRFEFLFPQGIPIYRIQVDSKAAPLDALILEIEENTQRRNYTADEIRQAAYKLEKAGYERLKGRPKAGQLSLKRALQSIFRLSDRRIQSILNTDPTSSKPVKPSSFSSYLQNKRKSLSTIQKEAQKWDCSPKEQMIVERIERLLKEIEALDTK